MKMKNSPVRLIIATGVILAILMTMGCSNQPKDMAKEKEVIATLLDAFNEAAAKADFNAYFDFYSDDAVFIGTDAGEYWDKTSLMSYAKPYFDSGKAWSFTSVERHIYFDNSGTVAWFDELLSTQMKICRGSGVLTRQGGEWTVRQYVLSMTIPNEVADTVIKVKSPSEDVILQKMLGTGE